MTHRQFLTWVEWMEEEWNRPDRADFYAMQTACEVRRVLSKDPNRITQDQFRLRFSARKAEEGVEPMTVERAAAISKARWFAVVGRGTTIRGWEGDLPGVGSAPNSGTSLLSIASSLTPGQSVQLGRQHSVETD